MQSLLNPPQLGIPTHGGARSQPEARPRTSAILIIDDDLITGQILQAVLSAAGFVVSYAASVEEAFGQLQAALPDLILLDVELPDGSGFDVCRRIQSEAITAQIPVLFISSNDELSSKVMGFEAGGVDYIPKPIAAAEVLARVGTHLRLKRSFEALSELQAERIQRLAVAQETVMPSPRGLPEANFEVYLKQTHQAGGDFYDVVNVGCGLFDYIVADASGHDLAASFWTASLKTLLGEYATADNSPMNILRSINSALNRILPTGVYFTALYARLNRRTGRLVLINAGHPPAVVGRCADESATVIRQEGDVVGAFPDVAFGMTELNLLRGDRLFLFSDGLIETSGSREDGLRRLTAACRAGWESPLDVTVHSIVPEVTGERSLQDDVLLLGIEL